jgi:tetratricopeptide (TPR) repeat protein
MPGTLILVSILLSDIKNKRIFYLIAVSAIVILITCSWNRLWVMGNEYLLWNDAAILLENQNLPGAARIYYNRGKALLKKEEWALSIEDFQRVVDIHPEIHQAYSNMGIAYYHLKSMDNALESFNKSVDINPNYALGHFGKAMTLKKMGQATASEDAFKTACDLGHQTSCIINSYIKEQQL